MSLPVNEFISAPALPTTSRSSAMSMAYENELGATGPLGMWDPLGLVSASWFSVTHLLCALLCCRNHTGSERSRLLSLHLAGLQCLAREIRSLACGRDQARAHCDDGHDWCAAPLNIAKPALPRVPVEWSRQWKDWSAQPLQWQLTPAPIDVCSRASRLAHALAGYIAQTCFRWPGYLSTSSDVKFADLPNGIKGLAGVPPLGLAQILLFIGLMEIGNWQFYEGGWPGKVPAGKAPGDVAGDFWVRYTDPAVKATKLNIELNNGRAAMMGITGMLMHDHITGSWIPPGL